MTFSFGTPWNGFTPYIRISQQHTPNIHTSEADEKRRKLMDSGAIHLIGSLPFEAINRQKFPKKKCFKNTVKDGKSGDSKFDRQRKNNNSTLHHELCRVSSYTALYPRFYKRMISKLVNRNNAVWCAVVLYLCSKTVLHPQNATNQNLRVWLCWCLTQEYSLRQHP